MGHLIRLDILINAADDIARTLKAKAAYNVNTHSHTHTHTVGPTEGCCLLISASEVKCSSDLFSAPPDWSVVFGLRPSPSLNKFPHHAPSFRPFPLAPCSFCNLQLPTASASSRASSYPACFALLCLISDDLSRLEPNS